MWRSGCLFLAAPLLCSSAGCLLYTDSFNSPPEVSIDGPESVVKGKPQEFTALVSDRNDDASKLSVEWFFRDLKADEECPKNLQAMRSAQATGRNQSRERNYSLLVEQYGDVCLCVIVTDSAGASSFQTRSFHVQNAKPVPKIELVTPAPVRWVGTAAYVALYSQAHLTARGSRDDDDDPLTYHWTINGEDYSGGCAESTADTDICRTLDRPGDYRFKVDVSDGTDGASFELPVSVMTDAPPCIRQTEPAFGLPRIVAFASERTSIQVLEVSDDGDPFPARPGQISQAAFVWHYGPAGTPVDKLSRPVSTTMPSISFVPDTFRPGDEIEVLLDVFDRVPDRDFRACNGMTDCELDAGSGCKQRVSWNVSFL